MKLTKQQLTQHKQHISKMCLLEVKAFREKVSMSHIGNKGELYDLLDKRESRLNRNNAILIRSEIESDN